MVSEDNLIDLSPIGMNFYVKKTAADTGGESLELEWEVFPGMEGTPIHIHPHAFESYRMLEGEMEFYVDGEWMTLTAGEEVKVEKGIPHTFRNASEAPARVYNIHSPALKMQDYFQELENLAHSGTINAPEVDLKAVLHLSVLMTRYPEEILQVVPPPPVVKVMAFIGRLLGYEKNLLSSNGKV